MKTLRCTYSFITLLLITASAHATERYEVSITNGSAMPISPGVLYAIEGTHGTSEPGTVPSPGLAALCQAGNNAIKLSELKANRWVSSVVATPGLILPGKTAQIIISVRNPRRESLHFEAMYGKSRALCSIADFEQIPQAESVRDDHVIDAGTFNDIALPKGSPAALCSGVADAISCLRALSESSESPRVRFFRGYLPSVLEFLEDRYDAAQVQELILPTSSGAVRVRVRNLGGH